MGTERYTSSRSASVVKGNIRRDNGSGRYIARARTSSGSIVIVLELP